MDSMTVYYAEPVEIAMWLLNEETALSELQAIDTFAEKAALVDSVVWQKCKDNPQRYLEIYGDNGKYSKDAKEAIRKANDDAKDKEDDNAWKEACDFNTYKAYEEYRSKFNYQGKHDVDAVKKMDEILRKEQEILQKEREQQEAEARAAEARAAEDALWNDVQAKHTKAAYQSYLDQYPSGRYASEARNSKEDLAWNDAIMKDTILSYQNYLDTYPSGRYASQARTKQEEKRQENKRKIIAQLEKDPNAHNLEYIKNEGITAEDLRGKIKDSNGQVHDELLDRWNATGVSLAKNKDAAPKSISVGSTEVYFWGIPGSGKTCAMAAILSQAKKDGHFQPLSGTGLEYMMQLSCVFHPESTTVSILPERTTTETTEFLPFILNERVTTGILRREEIRPHKVSIIELSGEIFKCFGEQIKGKVLPAGLKETFDQLNTYLKSGNPKYHFFVLDSMTNDLQSDALQLATLYFNEHKLFDDKTQGISIIVTKCDTLTKSKDIKEMHNSAKDYADKTFAAFITTLEGIAKGLGITDGSIPIHPLSIGQVFFQQMCLFDGGSAKGLVQTLMDYAKTDEVENRLSFFNN